MGLDISRCATGVGLIGPSGRATSLTLRFDPHVFASFQATMHRLRDELAERGVKPSTIVVEEQFSEADVFDHDRVRLHTIADRRLWNMRSMLLVGHLWPDADVVGVHPRDTLRLAFGERVHQELGMFRLKPVLYELVKERFPELGLPEVQHRLREDGSISMDDDVRYDESDAISLAMAGGAPKGPSA